MQPSLPLGLILDRARQRAGKPFRLEPRSERSVPQVWLVLGGLTRLRPQPKRLLDANRHWLPLTASNDHALLPAHAGESAAPRRNSIAWPVSSSNLFGSAISFDFHFDRYICSALFGPSVPAIMIA